MNVIGIDIGGANLKFSDGFGTHQTIPFALWRNPAGLGDALKAGLKKFPSADALAITMTGELCDCFESKRAGVQSIVEAVESVSNGLIPVSFYQVSGKFVDGQEACGNWKLTAASNWHSIAALTALEFPLECGILVDIGSTTTDLIRFKHGLPHPQKSDDLGRMLCEELLYCGTGRTPLNVLLPEYPATNRRICLAGEYFATIEDALIVNGMFPERPDEQSPCDGRPLSIQYCRRRIAKMLCADADELDDGILREIALAAQRKLLRRLTGGIQRLISAESAESDSPTERIVFSGSGERMARPILRRLGWTGQTTFWSELFGREASSAAAAFAIARLARFGAGSC